MVSDEESLALCGLAAWGGGGHQLFPVPDAYARNAVARGPWDGRMGTIIPGAIQELSGAVRIARANGESVRGTQRPDGGGGETGLGLVLGEPVAAAAPNDGG